MSQAIYVVYRIGDSDQDCLTHYGVPGMKWGHRKAQYYQTVGNRYHTRAANQAQLKVTRLKSSGNEAKAAIVQTKSDVHRAKATASQQKYDAKQTAEYKEARKQKAKKIAKGAAVAGTLAAGAYGAYKLNKYVKTKNCEIAAKKGYEYAEKAFQTNEKMTYDRVRSAMKDPNIKKVYAEVNANSGLRAREAANRASQDNFRKAAKNVIDYRRQGGSLRELNGAVTRYGSRTGSSTVFGSRR